MWCVVWFASATTVLVLRPFIDLYVLCTHLGRFSKVSCLVYVFCGVCRDLCLMHWADLPCSYQSCFSLICKHQHCSGLRLCMIRGFLPLSCLSESLHGTAGLGLIFGYPAQLIRNTQAVEWLLCEQGGQGRGQSWRLMPAPLAVCKFIGLLINVHSGWKYLRERNDFRHHPKVFSGIGLVAE